MVTAKQAFSGYSPNFMTPEVLSYKESKDYWVEVSKGEGFDHQPIYGVTVIRKNNQESARDLSQMFHTMTEALQHIGILFGTYKPDDN